MQDLNDLDYFLVVDQGGFAPAARALALAASELNRRIAALEGRLGVRLIQRSTRQFSVNEVGDVVHAVSIKARIAALPARAARLSLIAMQDSPDLDWTRVAL